MGNIDDECGERNQNETEPEEGRGEYHTVHSQHHTSDWDMRPDVAEKKTKLETRRSTLDFNMLGVV